MILVHFQGKPFNITVFKSMSQPLNAKVAEAAWYYEDLQELTPKKNNVLFHHRGLECKNRKSRDT